MTLPNSLRTFRKAETILVFHSSDIQKPRPIRVKTPLTLLVRLIVPTLFSEGYLSMKHQTMTGQWLWMDNGYNWISKPYFIL